MGNFAAYALRPVLLEEVGAGPVEGGSDEALLCGVLGAPVARGSVLGAALATAGGLRALCAMDDDALRELGLLARERARLRQVVELARRLQRSGERRPVVSSARAAFAALRGDMACLRREVFHVLCLNPRNVLLRNVRVAEGGATACAVDPREVFAPAISTRAAAIIVAHNHPSGDPTPSVEDVRLTRQLATGAEALGVRLLDHLVVADGTYCSFAERGLLVDSGR